MYLRNEYSETDLPTLHNFIQANPLGILTTGIPSSNHPFLQCSHIPWVLDTSKDDSDNNTSNLGTLRGHIARQNPQTKAIIESLSHSVTASNSSTQAPQLESQVLILFNSPVAHYVTPKFYRETKPATGKVAPTWNYAAVQVYGRATIYHDSSSPDTHSFLSTQLDDLSRFTETEIMDYTGEEGKEKPWGMDEAPERYLAMLKKNIVGIEVNIQRIDGKFKMSQERPVGDREGVVDGFRRLGTHVGEEMSELVKERGELSDRKKSEKDS